MADRSRVGMNHEKDQNHLAGCSFILRAGQLCGSVCVCGPCRERMGLMCEQEQKVWEPRIKISRLMSHKCLCSDCLAAQHYEASMSPHTHHVYMEDA